MKLKITLMKSPIACQPKQKATDNPAIRGQIFAVKHMVKVEEVNE